jgi:hypothetical protein
MTVTVPRNNQGKHSKQAGPPISKATGNPLHATSPDIAMLHVARWGAICMLDTENLQSGPPNKLSTHNLRPARNPMPRPIAAAAAAS